MRSDFNGVVRWWQRFEKPLDKAEWHEHADVTRAKHILYTLSLIELCIQ